MRNASVKQTVYRATALALMCLVCMLTDVGIARAQNVINAVGQVTEKSTGLPLIGANVLEKGTTNGVITDIDGNYSLKVKKGAYTRYFKYRL